MTYDRIPPLHRILCSESENSGAEGVFLRRSHFFLRVSKMKGEIRNSLGEKAAHVGGSLSVVCFALTLYLVTFPRRLPSLRYGVGQ